jgi:hypothetical protein
VHQIATGAATGPQASKFQQHVRDIEAQAKNKLAEASALGVPKKLPRWAWAGMIGAALAGLGYAVFERKKVLAIGHRVSAVGLQRLKGLKGLVRQKT